MAGSTLGSSTGIWMRCGTRRSATFRPPRSRGLILTLITGTDSRGNPRPVSNSTEIGALDLRIPAQGGGLIVQNDSPRFQHVTVARNFQGQIRVLFHQQD